LPSPLGRPKGRHRNLRELSVAPVFLLDEVLCGGKHERRKGRKKNNPPELAKVSDDTMTKPTTERNDDHGEAEQTTTTMETKHGGQPQPPQR
jgi:hypothetical protein